MSRCRVLVFTLIFSLCCSFSSWAVDYSQLYDGNGFAKQIDTYSVLSLSASNAARTLESNGDVVVRSSVGSVSNTVDFSGATVGFWDASGTSIGYTYVSIGGTFSFTVPAGKSVKYFELQMNSHSLPTSGKFLYKIDFSSDLDYGGYSSFVLYMRWKSKNETYKSNFYTVPSSKYVQSSGDYYWSSNIDLQSNIDAFTSVSYLSTPLPAGSAIGGKFSCSFDRLSSSTTTDISSPGVAPSTDDIQSSISNTTSQIASSVNDVYDSIHDLMQHISNQLAALWDQLYNYMHVPTFNKLQEILQAIQAIQIKVNVDTSSVVDAINGTTDKVNSWGYSIRKSVENQISNDDKNTEDLKNGYDNSGMTADNDRLNSKISEYDDVENQLFDDAKDKIGNFAFENPLTQYTSVLSDISYFLSGIYTALGALNIPVGFSLTLTIALIFIGYYRFKGGA